MNKGLELHKIMITAGAGAVVVAVLLGFVLKPGNNQVSLSGSRFEVVYIGSLETHRTISVLRDNENNVEYLVVKHGPGLGICPLVENDSTTQEK